MFVTNAQHMGEFTEYNKIAEDVKMAIKHLNV